MQAPGVGGWRALVDEGAFIDYLLSLEVPKVGGKAQAAR
jgi:hypothetical protein